MSATRPPSYDDRFVVPLEPSRRGAHRARMSPVIAVLPVVAVVAVVVAVIGLAWTLFGGTLLGGGSGTTQAASVTPLATSAAAGAGGAAQSPAATQPSTPAATPTETQTEAKIDMATKVVVFNTTNRAGLARRTSETLKTNGWTKATYSRQVPTAGPTVVYYATADQKAAAAEIVKELTVGQVKKSAALVADGIAVVVGSDFP